MRLQTVSGLPVRLSLLCTSFQRQSFDQPKKMIMHKKSARARFRTWDPLRVRQVL
jgi:hypothetical protein